MNLDEAYEEHYFEARSAEEARREAMRRQEFERLAQRVEIAAGGTVLDVGCGLGEFLDLFPQSWSKLGIEVSQHAIDACRVKGIGFELPEGGGWCDVVVLRGSLQHLDRPVETLFRTFEWLRPGGLLAIVATPNAGGPVYRLFQELPPLVPELNFVVFSDRELRQALLNIGFREIELVYPYLGTPYASPLRDHLRFLLRLLGRRRNFAFWRNMMECYARR